jgi:hypothetical protein
LSWSGLSFGYERISHAAAEVREADEYPADQLFKFWIHIGATFAAPQHSARVIETSRATIKSVLCAAQGIPSH